MPCVAGVLQERLTAFPCLWQLSALHHHCHLLEGFPATAVTSAGIPRWDSLPVGYFPAAWLSWLQLLAEHSPDEGIAAPMQGAARSTGGVQAGEAARGQAAGVWGLFVGSGAAPAEPHQGHPVRLQCCCAQHSSACMHHPWINLGRSVHRHMCGWGRTALAPGMLPASLYMMLHSVTGPGAAGCLLLLQPPALITEQVKLTLKFSL